MTVCIATLCDNKTTVVGISDRMVTASDVQFEPPQPKIVDLTSSIVLMTAGDSGLNAEILNEVRTVINERIEAEPDNWWKVSDVAKLYQQKAADVLAAKAETSLLAPFGLTMDSFISRQREMDPSFVEKLATEILNFNGPYAQVIITGVDKTGFQGVPASHIFLVDSTEIICYDKIGFACIGIGQWHANSQLMFDNYTPTNPLFYSLFLAM